MGDDTPQIRHNRPIRSNVAWLTAPTITNYCGFKEKTLINFTWNIVTALVIKRHPRPLHGIWVDHNGPHPLPRGHCVHGAHITRYDPPDRGVDGHSPASAGNHHPTPASDYRSAASGVRHPTSRVYRHTSGCERRPDLASPTSQTDPAAPSDYRGAHHAMLSLLRLVGNTLLNNLNVRLYSGNTNTFREVDVRVS